MDVKRCVLARLILALAPVKNNRGSSLLIYIVIVTAVSLMLAAPVFMNMENIMSVGQQVEIHDNRKKIIHEIKVVLANPALCANNLQVAASTFTIGARYVPAAIINNIRLETLDVANKVDLGGGRTSADFNIALSSNKFNFGAALNWRTTKQYRIPVIYQESLGVVTGCGIVADLKDACESFGASWIVAENRCGICEDMGGVWGSGKCNF